MLLVIPLTGARPGSERITTRIQLRIPHGLNQDSTRTMEFDFREVEPLSALRPVRTRSRRSNSVQVIPMKAVFGKLTRPISHVWFIGEYTMFSADTRSVGWYS